MPSDQVYSSTRWRKLRLKVIAEQPVCVLCNRLPSNVVDHRIAWKSAKSEQEREYLLWDRSNLRGCCKTCHDRKTSAKDNPHAFGRWQKIPDYIERPRMPVTIVCGAEGSGREMYVSHNFGAGDLIIDHRQIAMRLSGENLHRADMKKWLAPAMLERNRILSTLSTARYDGAWLVVSGEKLSDRRKWREVLGCKVIVLETDIDVCEERIRHSPRLNRKRHIASVTRWWKNYTADPKDTVVRNAML